jgi:DNA repair protein REV1
MKVVRPEWLVESARVGELLPWQDFIFRPGNRMDGSQGTTTAQKSLLDVFTVQAPMPPNVHTLHTLEASEVELEDRTNDQDALRLTPPPIPESSKKTLQSTSPGKPLITSTTDPGTPEQASRVPGYAAHASNPNAKRAMADPEWRSAHTSAAPDFIEGYYKNSRLHHLATWKAELKNLVAEAQERAESGLTPVKSQLPRSLETAQAEVALGCAPGEERQSTTNVSMKGAELVRRSPKGKAKARPDEERVIMHCDFDCFFVSAGLVGRPHLRGKPFVVCHSQGSQGGTSSTSEIACASYEARKFGVKNGMRFVFT